jgi:hypothetical protein
MFLLQIKLISNGFAADQTHIECFAANQTHVEYFYLQIKLTLMFLLQIKLTLNVFAADQTHITFFAADQTHAEDCVRKAGERDGAGEAGHEQRRP